MFLTMKVMNMSKINRKQKKLLSSLKQEGASYYGTLKLALWKKKIKKIKNKKYSFFQMCIKN